MCEKKEKIAMFLKIGIIVVYILSTILYFWLCARFYDAKKASGEYIDYANLTSNFIAIWLTVSFLVLCVCRYCINLVFIYGKKQLLKNVMLIIVSIVLASAFILVIVIFKSSDIALVSGAWGVLFVYSIAFLLEKRINKKIDVQ